MIRLISSVILSVIFLIETVIAEPKTQNIQIGISFPLTGDLAPYGESQKNGALLAAEEINASGGVKGRSIELLIEDNAFNPSKQMMIVKKFIDINKVDALISAWTILTLPILPLIDHAKLPTFTWMAMETGASSKYLFNMFSDMTQGARAIVNRAQKDNIKDAVYISVESNEVDAVDVAVREESKKCGINLNGPHKFDTNTTDFRSILTRMKTIKTDAFFVFVLPQHFPTIVRQMSQLGMDKKRLYDIGCAAYDKTVSGGLEPIFEKMQAVSTWYTFDARTPTTKQFVKAYEKRFESSPQPYAAIGYTALQLLSKAFESCLPSPQDLRTCVRDSLLKQGRQDSPAGMGQMDDDGDFHLPIALLRFENGKFVADD